MSKPLKYAVAIVAKGQNTNEFLIVKRPESDPDLGGMWGLPAATSQPGELPEETARRVCREKLGCSGQPIRFLGSMTQRRNSYDLCLMDFEVQIVHDTPDVKTASTNDTVYTAQKWTSEPLELMPAARHGSCCASIYLASCGLLDREQWVLSLEGSSIVA